MHTTLRSSTSAREHISSHRSSRKIPSCDGFLPDRARRKGGDLRFRTRAGLL